jgi:hypothetical protein
MERLGQRSFGREQGFGLHCGLFFYDARSEDSCSVSGVCLCDIQKAHELVAQDTSYGSLKLQTCKTYNNY